MFERGRLGEGENFLVHGGTSGIGTTAIQLARARGARVFTTAGSNEKCEACRNLGAHVAVNYHDADFVSVVKENGGADVILDMVGGDYMARNVKSANADARIVQIAYLTGSKVAFDFMPVMLKRLTLTGSTLRARTPEVKAAIAQAVETHVWPLIATGELKPIIDSTFPSPRPPRLTPEWKPTPTSARSGWRLGRLASGLFWGRKVPASNSDGTKSLGQMRLAAGAGHAMLAVHPAAQETWRKRRLATGCSTETVETVTEQSWDQYAGCAAE